ncbi:hypothetical protein ACQPZJ_43060 [Actinoplanes sp. CA-054009]
MREILCDPAYVVPAVAPGDSGVAWLRGSVGRFCAGEDHVRRRGLAEAILDDIPPESLEGRRGHPVAVLAAAMGVTDPGVASLVEDVARAYQPGSGDERIADAAVERLVAIFGGRHDEGTAARIGVLVQGCAATLALIERARRRPVEDVLRDDPPVPFTKRRRIDSEEIVLVPLAGETAFGAGPRRCPGRAHALALVRAAEQEAQDASR